MKPILPSPLQFLQRKKKRRRRDTAVHLGAAPGTLRIAEDALPTQVRVMAYNEETIHEAPIEDLETLRALLVPGTVVWVDVVGLGTEATLQALGAMFNFHRLALEDVAHVGQRPKVESYDDDLFMVTRMLTLGNEEVEGEQLSMLLGRGWLVTFQERPGDCLEPVRERLRGARGRIRQKGADYLLYALIDAVVDHYFPVLEELSERIEALEDEVIVAPEANHVPRIHVLKREVVALRRVIWPQREALSALLRADGEFPRITDETLVFLRDCHDHASQAVDVLDSNRELTSGLMDAYMSLVSHKLNEVMQTLTVISAIFVPLSFVAGLYGMNFNTESPYNMPELGWRFGYVAAVSLMLLVALSFLTFFWRKGWLGRRRRRPRQRASARRRA